MVRAGRWPTCLLPGSRTRPRPLGEGAVAALASTERSPGGMMMWVGLVLAGLFVCLIWWV